jgi:quercetin dioxygenase-like cupin family protein
MNVSNAPRAAADAIAVRADRPVGVVLHDSADARLIVFQIPPGQQVPPHTNASAVVLTVLSGAGVVSGGDGERAVGPGAVVVYAPEERHGMRAAAHAAEPFMLLAAVLPRPDVAHPDGASAGVPGAIERRSPHVPVA